MQLFTIVLTIRKAENNKIVYNSATGGAAAYLFDLVNPLNKVLADLQDAFDAEPDQT